MPRLRRFRPRRLLLVAAPALAACLCVVPLLARALPGVLLPVAVELRAPVQIVSPGRPKGGGDLRAAEVRRGVLLAVRSAGGEVLGAPEPVGADQILELEIPIRWDGARQLLAELGRLGFQAAGETQAPSRAGLLSMLDATIRLRLRARIAAAGGADP